MIPSLYHFSANVQHPRTGQILDKTTKHSHAKTTFKSIAHCSEAGCIFSNRPAWGWLNVRDDHSLRV